MESHCTSNITFTAIKHFVEALVSVFGTGGGKSPLGFYNRLISHVEDKVSAQGVEKYVSGFKEFFSNFGSNLESIDDMMTIPRDTIIKYGDGERVYIEIQKFIYKSKSQPDQLNIIRQHLLTISATIKPDENLLVALEKSPMQTFENADFGSSFVKTEMDNIREVLENENIDMSDPINAMTVLASSGVITGMIERLKNAVDSGKLNPQKMLEGLQTTLADLMTDAGDTEGIDIQQIQSLTSQFMLNQEFVNLAQGATVEEVNNEIYELD